MSNNKNSVNQTLQPVDIEATKECFNESTKSVFESALSFHERAEYFRNVERPKLRRQKRNNSKNGGKK
jgi:hypothetical protein